MSPLSQFLMTAFVILISSLVFMVGSVLLALPLFGLNSIVSIHDLSNLTNPETVEVLKYFQVVQSIGLFVVPPMIIGWLFQGNFTEYLLLNKKISWTTALLVVFLIFFASPFINYVGALNSKMTFPGWLSGVEEWMRSAEDKAEQLTDAFLNVKTFPAFMFNMFMIAFLPAIGEEFLFRGVLQKILTNWTKNVHWGIWITAVLFSAFHFQFFGFLPRLLLGVIFGYLLIWSGSLWFPIIAHFVNNAAAVTVTWMVSRNMIGHSVEDIGATSGSLYFAVISLIITVTLLWYIKRLEAGGDEF